MDIVELIVQILVAVIGCIALLISIPLFFAFRWPAPVMWIMKLFVSALSPVLAFTGVLISIVGETTGSFFISIIGIVIAIIYFIHFIIITRPPDISTGFEQAFGKDWEENIPPTKRSFFLPSRIILRLRDVPEPRLQQNISFTTIPGTSRTLLCDIWQPPESVSPSGLALIYLHGSAWYMLDKDLGTRPLFRYLAAQGHVIMDVAHRLAPETDMMGMVHDVKRAIVWMKENANTYKVNPDKIIVSGGSAGAHLALLAAYTADYTADNSEFTPKEIEGKDVSVCAVISMYGPTDLEAMYYHLNQHLTTRTIPGRPKKTVPTQMPGWIKKNMGENYHRLGFDKGFENAGNFSVLLGGHPDECLERFFLYSPVMHVHPDCPPTLLIHGAHDLMAPVKTVRILYTRLVEKKVPVVMHILPQTDHAFDLILTKINPSAHNAIYDVERFLALMARRKGISDNKKTATGKFIVPVAPGEWDNWSSIGAAYLSAAAWSLLPQP